jgi:hypothetical protein
MSSIFVVVANVVRHQPFEMPLVEHDDVIKQVFATVAHPAFRNSVLPRTANTGPLRFDTEALYCANGGFIEVRGPIKDQIVGCRVVRKSFAKLLGGPGTRRMLRHIAVHNTPLIVRDHEEPI